MTTIRTALETLNDDLFPRLLAASWQAALLAVLVWLVTLATGRWIGARWRCALWSIVFIRLLMPALPPSPVSLLNLRPATPVGTLPAAMASGETVTFGVIPVARPAVATAAPPVETPVAAPLPWLPLAWLAVALAIIIRGAVAYGLLIRKIRRLTPIDDPPLIALCAGRIDAVETDLVTAPALIGVFRPRLLLPAGLLDRLLPGELRFVVLHELAHACRRDLLVAAAVAVVTALHWFNPFAWLAAARFRNERELACDEAVLAATQPAERAEYGRAILRLLELLPATRSRPPVGVVGVLSASRRALRRRIAIIAAAAPRRVAPLGPILLVVLGALTLTGPRDRAAVVAPAIQPASTPATATTTTATGDPLDTTTAVYDVRDLLVEIPDFVPRLETDEDGWPIATPATTQASAAAATQSASTQPAAATQQVDRARNERLRKLIADITGSVDPMSWRDNTGTLGAIRELQGQLIITQTRANHERILQKLQALRGPRARQITVEARFLRGVDAEAVLGGKWSANEGRDGKELWPRFLTNDDVTRLLRALQGEAESTVVTAPRLTLFDGQRAYVMVTRQTAYVADLKKPPAANADVEPVIKLFTSGIVFDVRAQVFSDDDGGANYVTLMLRPRWSELLGLVPQRWPGGPAPCRPGSRRTRDPRRRDRHRARGAECAVPHPPGPRVCRHPADDGAASRADADARQADRHRSTCGRAEGVSAPLDTHQRREHASGHFENCRGAGPAAVRLVPSGPAPA